MSALTGCATGGSPNGGGSDPIDAAKQPIERPVDARVDASPDEPDAEVADARPIDAPPDACTPSCSGRSCGDDQCEGSCGSCDSGQTCSDEGKCTSSGTGCDAPRWAAPGNYAVGTVVTSVCQDPTNGTPCYGHAGALFAWRCTSAEWSKLQPGSDQSGWWTAWAEVARCD
jgi:hypothetical protein